MATLRGRVLRGESAAVALAPARLDLLVTRNEEEELARRFEDAVAEGRQQGFDEGWKAGMRLAAEEAATAEAERDELCARAVDAVRAAAARIDAHQAVELQHVEDAVVTAAFELARGLLGRELELAADPGRDAIARAMALAPRDVPAVVRLNPADLERLGDISTLVIGREVQLVPDFAVEAGGCIVDAGGARVDAQLGPAVERLRAALFT